MNNKKQLQKWEVCFLSEHNHMESMYRAGTEEECEKWYQENKKLCEEYRAFIDTIPVKI